MENNWYDGFTQEQLRVIEKHEALWQQRVAYYTAFKWLEKRLGPQHKHVVDFRVEIMNPAEKLCQEAADKMNDAGVTDILIQRLNNKSPQV